MLKQADNKIKIEGILSEINLDTGSFVKNGQTVESISGMIKVRVPQEIAGKMTTLEIPVHMFASKYTNLGKPNPAYDSIKKVMNEFVSIAAAGEEKADRIRITNGQISMNEYISQSTNQLVSFPRVSATFITKVRPEDYKPTATFDVTFVIGDQFEEVGKDGCVSGRYVVKGIIPQYGGKVDVVPFIGVSENAINAMSTCWQRGDTVKATGKLNFSSTTETIEIPVDFGEPSTQTRTINVSEFIITGGTQPLEGDFAYDNDEISAALAERKVRLEAVKQGSKSTSKTAPKTPSFKDLGF